MNKKISQLLRRPNDPLLLLLTSLASGPKHGYALSKDVEDFAGVTLSPGTLYGAITRLEELGLIEPLKEVERRRPYRLTTNGAQVLREVTSEMRRLADVGVARLRLATGGA
jgi:DNA-binding PadR family transcriptional regulator